MSLNIGILESSRSADAAPFTFLLDLHPGARTAISFRKLRSTYTGNCIQVRRSSDNTTLNIGFVNNVLDVATLTTFVGANNGFISIWYDQGTLGNNFIQNTLANQPQIIIAGVLQLVNGKPAAYCNSTVSNITVTTSLSGVTNTFDVMKTADTNFILYHAGANSNELISVGTQSSTGTLINSGATVTSYYKNNVLQTPPTNRGQVYTLISTNAQILLSYVASLTNWGSVSLSGYGSGFQLECFKQEFIIYFSQTPNISAINTNINSFYTIY
jgi:hypothetical protein